MKIRTLRIIVDAAMVMLLPVVMARAMTGGLVHELAGTIMAVLFIAHHVLNLSRWKGLFEGKYSPRRLLFTGVDFLLLIYMILQPLTGILMSDHLFTSVSFPGVSGTVIDVHKTLCWWGFVLMSVHAGMHMDQILAKIRGTWEGNAVWTCFILVSIWGLYAFAKRVIPGLILRNTADSSVNPERVVSGLFDYLAMIVMFALAGVMMIRVLSMLRHRLRKNKA